MANIDIMLDSSIKNNKKRISSEQLMHFVSKKTYLIDILNHNFYPRLCLENNIEPFFKNANAYIPMKCFCDIPIECIKEHMKTYGEYGVGFTKSWGIRTGITPVIYFNDKSPYTEHIRNIYNKLIDYINKHPNDVETERTSEAIEAIVNFKKSFTLYKPIYGKNERVKKDNYCFYDEREWRYIITGAGSVSGLPSFMLNEKSCGLFDDSLIQRINTKLKLNNQIEFTYDDIEFVIIKNGCMKESILRNLRVPPSEIEKIKPKIKTIDTLNAIY